MSSALTCAEFVDLSAALALGAAEPEDARRIEEHARVCPACQRQLEGFREVAAAIGAAVPRVDPPAGARARLLELVAHTPQERLSRARPRTFRRLSPAWWVAAASFLVSILALAWVASLQAQVASLQAQAQIQTVSRAAIRSMQPVSVEMKSRGIVYLDPASGTGMVMCHGLPPLEQGHAYQVWFVRGPERISGGMLWPDRFGDGYTLIQVPSDVQSFDSIGLTDEPGSGSAWPTTPRVLGTPLRESAQ